jgi:UDP-glucose 4-epimerase
MRVAVFGGTGFVGLNVAERLLGAGDDVVVFDRNPPPDQALDELDRLAGTLTVETASIEDPGAVARAVAGAQAVVYGAAVTSDAAREAADPRSVLAVNLMGWLGVLEAARAAGVARVVGLSSASAYGEAAFGANALDEAATPPDPRTLYAISKVASERVGARLADLWDLDVRSVRLSSVFGPWERATGVRDTLSPPFQVMRAALRGEPVQLERRDERDWVYAPDVARAVEALLRRGEPGFDLYNIGPGRTWDLLRWAGELRRWFPGLGPTIDPAAPTIAAHAPRARRPLRVDRLRQDLGIDDMLGCAASADHYARWARMHAALIAG